MAVKFALVLALVALVEIQNGLAVGGGAQGLSATLGTPKTPADDAIARAKEGQPEIPPIVNSNIHIPLGNSREQKDEKKAAGENTTKAPARVARADRYRRDHDGHQHDGHGQDHGQGKPQGQDAPHDHSGHDHKSH
ncbi:hypothetical protein KM043_018382 [Ampulex compressa]|nr:hypothetical protein KM043_018382 [Ampulex compressa]